MVVVVVVVVVVFVFVVAIDQAARLSRALGPIGRPAPVSAPAPAPALRSNSHTCPSSAPPPTFTPPVGGPG